MAVLVNMENPTTTLRFGAPGESWRKSAQIPLVRDLELESECLALEDLGNGHYVVRQLSEEAIQALREVDCGETMGLRDARCRNKALLKGAKEIACQRT